MKTIEYMAEAFSQRLEYRRANPQLKSMELFYEIQKEHYHNLLKAKEENRPVAWLGILAPLELMHAMDIVPFLPEAHAIAVGFPEGEEYLQLSDGHGLSPETCSPHRAAMGMSIAGDVPSPDILINTSSPCDSGIKIFQNFGKHYGKPAFMLDNAYSYDTDAIEYYKEELRGLIRFIEENTGCKLDYDRLVECCKNSHRAFEKWVDICKLRRNRPSPIRGRDAFRDRGVNNVAAGLPEAVEYFKVRYDELKLKVENGQGAIPDERYRLFWHPTPVFHNMKLMDWMEHEHNAVVAIDSFNTPAEDFQDADPSDPIDYLARKSYSDMLGRTTYGDAAIEGSMETLCKICEEWHVDGAIFFAHFSCHQVCGLFRIYKDGLDRNLGIPTVILDGDVLDPRVVSSDMMRGRLNEFFAMIKAKAEAGKAATD